MEFNAVVEHRIGLSGEDLDVMPEIEKQRRITRRDQFGRPAVSEEVSAARELVSKLDGSVNFLDLASNYSEGFVALPLLGSVRPTDHLVYLNY